MDEIEKEIQEKGLTAPRIKPEDITANIAHVEYVTHASKGGQVLRWAVITTLNGFAVVGKPACAVSPENDNEEIGKQVAYENSRNELWPLMGYELKCRLHQQEQFMELCRPINGTEEV
jgi:Phage protein (N4 Gp49/phage Sf6 gene 66) family